MCFFLAGNTVIILNSCPLKMRILRFVVHSVLVSCHNKQDPSAINAVLPHGTSFSSYLEKEYTEMERNLKAMLNVYVEAGCSTPAECN